MKKRQRSSPQPPFLSENKSQPWPFLVSAGFLVLCCCVLSSAFASFAVFYSLFTYYLIIKFIPSLANYYINFAKIFSFKKWPSSFASLALLPFWFTLHIISHLLFSRKKDPPALGESKSLSLWFSPFAALSQLLLAKFINDHGDVFLWCASVFWDHPGHVLHHLFQLFWRPASQEFNVYKWHCSAPFFKNK